MIIPLLGHFQTEDGAQYHLTPLAYETRSGIAIGSWVERLIQIKAAHHQTYGPAFSDSRGNLLSSHWMEMEILDRLQEIQNTRKDLIVRDVNVHEDYGIARSFKRVATMQACNAGVSENDINAMKRWRVSEQAKGHKPRAKMQGYRTTTQTSDRWSLPCCSFLKCSKGAWKAGGKGLLMVFLLGV